MRLGIDFGTTRTVVSVVDEGRYPLATFDVGGGFRQYLPSMAAFDGRGLCFGSEAAAVLRDNTGPVFRSVKRELGCWAPDEPLPNLPGATSVLELATSYLKWVRKMLLTRSNLELPTSRPLQAMVAVPANASTRQRYLTIDAFRRAGFEVLGLINEPTAAAIEYAHRERSSVSPRSPKRYMVVYDLGGGTFDTAAVSLQGRRFQLLSTEGVARLGGEEFDRIIYELAVPAAVRAELPPAAEVVALERCREAKEDLRTTSRRMFVDLEPIGFGLGGVVLDLAQVYANCGPLIQRTVKMVERLFDGLEASGIDPSNPRHLGALYLVGGSSVFPPVARALRAKYKRKLQIAPAPWASTAVGLAVAGDPAEQLFVREAVTRHFGVWREACDGREKVFDPILSKATLPANDEPIVVCRQYKPNHAIGHLRFLECTGLTEDGQPNGDLTPWDEVRFPYDPRLADAEELPIASVPRRQQQLDEHIVETYTHTADGKVEVEIENRTRGYRRAYVLGALA